MFVLNILGIVLLGFGFLISIIFFNQHCEKKFGHVFFHKVAFILITIAVGLALAGQHWYDAALSSNGDSLNGIVLMVLSALICISFIIYNVVKTNITYGVLGSVTQIAIFGTIGFFSLFILVIYCAICIIPHFYAKPVYVVNK